MVMSDEFSCSNFIKKIKFKTDLAMFRCCNLVLAWFCLNLRFGKFHHLLPLIIHLFRDNIQNTQFPVIESDIFIPVHIDLLYWVVFYHVKFAEGARETNF